MNSIQQKLEETYSSDDSSESEFWKDNKLELDGALIDNKKTNILYYINDENKSKTLTMVFPKKSIEFEIGNNFILHKHMKKIFDECDKMWLDLQEKISQISVEKYKITLKDKNVDLSKYINMLNITDVNKIYIDTSNNQVSVLLPDEIKKGVIINFVRNGDHMFKIKNLNGMVCAECFIKKNEYTVINDGNIWKTMEKIN